MNARVDLQRWLHRELFDRVPVNIAIIDRDFNVVEANRNFTRLFGHGRRRKCYELYKRRTSPCPNCMALATFQDGKTRVSDEVGINRHGRKAHYIVHIAPVSSGRGAAKQVSYVIEMSTDVTETKQWQREYQLLFERVPCYVHILDQDFRIVRANQLQRETFGDYRGKHCYEVYKRRTSKCEDCPAEMTFRDGRPHTSHQRGVARDGAPIHYIVTTASLSRPGEETAYVIEMATDVTRSRNLQDELQEAYSFQEALINNSIDGIIATDKENEVTIFNPAARALLQYDDDSRLEAADLDRILPAEFIETVNRKGSVCTLPETMLRTRGDAEIPVRFAGVGLRKKGELIGTACFIQDLRKIKQLEREKIEAERLAAVGQTVAGLAHSIKNILMGLEGGMYMVRTGLKKDNPERVEEGWGVLERNFEKTTSLVRDFLSFAKGRLPRVKMVDPNALVKEIVDLYRDTAERQGVALRTRMQKGIPWAPLDPEGIHTCLTNLVSNAIDACLMSARGGCRVTIATKEKDGALVFEVSDNGSGMDYDIKKKIFTSFFTTKGGDGTGLGLLTTRKLVQEHGGRIEVATAPGKGTVFTMIFPRHRLPSPPVENQQTAEE